MTPYRSAAILLFLVGCTQAGAGLVLLLRGAEALPERLIGRDPHVGILLAGSLLEGGLALLAAFALWRGWSIGFTLGVSALILNLVAGGSAGFFLSGSLLHWGTVRGLLIAVCIGLFLWIGHRGGGMSP